MNIHTIIFFLLALLLGGCASLPQPPKFELNTNVPPGWAMISRTLDKSGLWEVTVIDPQGRQFTFLQKRP